MAVHLVGDRQGEAVVSVADIATWAQAEGQPPADYRVREVAGGPTQLEGISQALPLRLFIAHLADQGGAFTGLTAADIRLVKIPRPRIGYVSTLEAVNLRPAGDNGLVDNQEPVLHTPGGTDTVAYARPLIDSSDDVNRLDIFQSDGNAPLDLTLSTTGAVLHPTITASPADPDAGQPVTFTATIPNAPTGTTFTWTFGGGGGTSTDPSPAHTWTGAGTYGVGLVVEAPDNSYGRAATVITVGDPLPPTATPTAPPTTGGGGGDGDGTGQTPSPTSGSPSSSPTSSPSSSPTSSPSASPTDETDPTESAQPSPETEGPDPSPPASPTPSPTATPTPQAAGRTVTGLLLSSSSRAERDDPQVSAAPDSSSTVTPVPERLRLTSTLVWSMIVLALLAAGAVSELAPAASRSRRWGRPHRLGPHPAHEQDQA